ncbi:MULTISPECIES: thermonuclease family protein [unclassified Prochlorococcus]|uniref:thermonuclease family protein n=1 Tax=unclassified Prochlorococcus TaxID=2627481 RepID=UPI000533B149|nr:MULTISPECIES: hypothetical protein [unclassified Prochlorococcus]KGG27587.1 nuclease [Prochlorococcus sp. MIT 0702]KGG28150.1 nuclease [Prochlorococcus sp. MIT 0701]KGG30555.1 nuclease [Prochlorococcus sp. MIT 0703]
MGKALLVLLFAVTEVPCNAAEVLSIGDGDTLTVTEGSRREIQVRLTRIDAPETSQPPYGITNSTTNIEESSAGWF